MKCEKTSEFLLLLCFILSFPPDRQLNYNVFFLVFLPRPGVLRYLPYLAYMYIVRLSEYTWSDLRLFFFPFHSAEILSLAEAHCLTLCSSYIVPRRSINGGRWWWRWFWPPQYLCNECICFPISLNAYDALMCLRTPNAARRNNQT